MKDILVCMVCVCVYLKTLKLFCKEGFGSDHLTN